MTFLYIFLDRFPLQEEMLKFIIFLNTNSFFEKIAKKNAMNNELVNSKATNGRLLRNIFLSGCLLKLSSEYQGFRARDWGPLVAVKINYSDDNY